MVRDIQWRIAVREGDLLFVTLGCYIHIDEGSRCSRSKASAFFTLTRAPSVYNQRERAVTDRILFGMHTSCVAHGRRTVMDASGHAF